MTATATQRREKAKVEYNAFLGACPSRQLLDLVASKWVCLILAALVDGPRRHSELRRDIAGVSQKMLTQTLRDLERDGLVTRAVTPSVPVRVDYALTDLGEGLRRVVQPLKQWAEDNMDTILGNRAAAEATCA